MSVNGGINPYNTNRKALSFDLYGCLLNYRQIQHFVGQIAIEHKLNADLAEMYYNLYYSRVFFGPDFVPFKTGLENVLTFVDMEMGTAKTFFAAFKDLYMLYKDLQPMPEVVNVLKSLRDDHGYELYLTSNADKPLTYGVFEALGNVFNKENTFTSEDIRMYKPRLDYFKAAAEKFQLRRADHFHVASSYFTDVLPALNLRWDVAYINRRTTGIIITAKPTIMQPNLENLAENIAAFRNFESTAGSGHSHKLTEEEKREEEEKIRKHAADNAKKIAEFRARRRAENHVVGRGSAADRDAGTMASFNSIEGFDGDQFGAVNNNFLQPPTEEPIMNSGFDTSGFNDSFGSAVNTFADSSPLPDSNTLKSIGVVTPFDLSDPREAKIAAQLKKASPAKARAIAAAREKALALSSARS